MALQDILHAIQKKQNKEIQKIDQQYEAEIKKIKKEWSEKIAKRKELLLSEAQKKASDKLRQNTFAIHAKARSKVNIEKKKIIDGIFEKLQKKLTKLSEKEKIDLLKSFLLEIDLPQCELRTNKESVPILEKAIQSEKKDYKIASEPLPLLGGFIAYSENLELDYSFDTLIHNLKKESLVELNSLLFG